MSVHQQRCASVRRLAPGRRLLDIGARQGDFVEIARAMGLLPVGVPSAIELGFEKEQPHERRDPPGARPRPDSETRVLQDLDPSFHAVTLWDVLPHVGEPAALVRQARRLLAPGGVLAISAPNAAGFGALVCGNRYAPLDPSRYGHLHQLTARGLAALVDRAGLTLLKIETRGVPDLPALARDSGRFRFLSRRSERFRASIAELLRPAAEAFDRGEVLTGYARR